MSIRHSQTRVNSGDGVFGVKVWILEEKSLLTTCNNYIYIYIYIKHMFNKVETNSYIGLKAHPSEVVKSAMSPFAWETEMACLQKKLVLGKPRVTERPVSSVVARTGVHPENTRDDSPAARHLSTIGTHVRMWTGRKRHSGIVTLPTL